MTAGLSAGDLPKHTDARLRFYLRRAGRLRHPGPRRVQIVEGDVLDSVSDVVAGIAIRPTLYPRSSLGIARA